MSDPWFEDLLPAGRAPRRFSVVALSVPNPANKAQRTGVPA